MDGDPFEAKLSLIWKIGCLEQKARLERDAAFEAKADAIRAHEASQSKNDGSQENGGSPTTVKVMKKKVFTVLNHFHAQI